MNKLPLRKESIIPRIDGITRNVVKLRALGSKPLAEFEKKEDTFDLSQHHLRLALEGVFHIGSHILSRLPGGRPTTYNEIASKLGDAKVVDRTFAQEKLVKMAGYRTRLTHFYHDITPKEIYDIIHTNLDDIEYFLTAINKLLTNPERIGCTLE
jgi:uncharacterized protein YutE (UPF0331/DUF86 family)